ncbi:MAG: class I SAM-dependent methyltransferase [Oligoflexia bacterium]|nr:class I SAM-dependent methyltransferase [Oligoflexia bacterium]
MELQVKLNNDSNHDTIKEDPRCKLCNSTKIINSIRFNKIQLIKCLGCGIVFQSTPFNEIIYNQSYYFNNNVIYGYTNYFQKKDDLIDTFSIILEEVKKHTKNIKNVLDIGCAFGYFMYLAKQQFPHVYGIDISSFATKMVSKKYGFSTITADICSPEVLYSSRNIKYDLVTMFDVIEHLSNPISAIKNIYDQLTEGGILVIKTPDISGLQSKIFYKFWYHYKPNEHLFYFSPVSITNLLLKANFEIIKISPASIFVSLNCIIDLMLRAINLHTNFKLIISKFRKYKIFLLIMKFLLPVYNSLKNIKIRFFIPNGEFVVIAQKKANTHSENYYQSY